MDLHHSANTVTSRGFATLTSVLLVGSIGSAVAMSLLLMGVDSARNSIATIQSEQANALATACAEEALQQIHDAVAFSGSGGFSLGDGTCTYSVTVGAGQSRTISATGIVGSVTKKITVAIDALTPKIQTTGWQEVGDF